MQKERGKWNFGAAAHPEQLASLRCRRRKRGARSAAAEEAQTRGLLSRAAVCPRPRQIAIGSCAMCTAEELPPHPAHA